MAQNLTIHAMVQPGRKLANSQIFIDKLNRTVSTLLNYSDYITLIEYSCILRIIHGIWRIQVKQNVEHIMKGIMSA